MAQVPVLLCFGRPYQCYLGSVPVKWQKLDNLMQIFKKYERIIEVQNVLMRVDFIQK